MPTKPLSPCMQSGCPRPAVARGRCAEHAAQVTARIEQGRGNSTERGYGYGWQQRRAAFLKANPWCVVCGEKATDADHIVPKAMGGTDDDSNLQPMCHKHHSAKTMRESIRR